MQVELLEELIRKRAKGICETKECLNEEGKQAVTFKGRVLLFVKPTRRLKCGELPSLYNHNAICWKCSLALDRVFFSKAFKPRAKEVNEEQSNLFN